MIIKLNHSKNYSINVKVLTNIRNMFSICSSIKELNLSNCYTNNVIYMIGMFFWCSSLKKLKAYNFNTNNVTNMSDMFSWFSWLKELNLSNCNTNNIAKNSISCSIQFGLLRSLYIYWTITSIRLFTVNVCLASSKFFREFLQIWILTT